MRNIAGLLIVPAILVAGCSDGGSTGSEQFHRTETAQGIDYGNQLSEKSKPEHWKAKDMISEGKVVTFTSFRS